LCCSSLQECASRKTGASSVTGYQIHCLHSDTLSSVPRVINLDDATLKYADIFGLLLSGEAGFADGWRRC